MNPSIMSAPELTATPHPSLMQDVDGAFGNLGDDPRQGLYTAPPLRYTRLPCGHVQLTADRVCTFCLPYFTTVYGGLVQNPFNRTYPPLSEITRSSTSDEANLFKMVDFDACCPARSPRPKTLNASEDWGITGLDATWAVDIQALCASQPPAVRELGKELQKKLLLFAHIGQQTKAIRALSSLHDAPKMLTESNVPELVAEVQGYVRDLAAGESMIMPVLSKEHVLVLEIRRSSDTMVSFTLFNAGDGLEFHERAVKEGGQGNHKYLFPVEFNRAPPGGAADLVRKIVEFNVGKSVFEDGVFKSSGRCAARLYKLLSANSLVSRSYPRTRVGRSLIPYREQIRGSCSYDSLRAWLRQECFDRGQEGLSFYRNFMHFQLARKCWVIGRVLKEEAVASSSYKSHLYIQEKAEEKLVLRERKIEHAQWSSYRREGVVPFLVSLFKKIVFFKWL